MNKTYWVIAIIVMVLAGITIGPQSFPVAMVTGGILSVVVVAPIYALVEHFRGGANTKLGVKDDMVNNGPKFCYNCGNQINPLQRFCGRCGAPHPIST